MTRWKSTRIQTVDGRWRRLTGGPIIVQVAVRAGLSELATVLQVVAPVVKLDPFAGDSVVVGYLFVEGVAVLDRKPIPCGIGIAAGWRSRLHVVSYRTS
jgi:hypothetical protein